MGCSYDDIRCQSIKYKYLKIITYLLSTLHFLDLCRLLTEWVPVAEGTLVLVHAGLAEAAVVAGEGAMSWSLAQPGPAQPRARHAAEHGLDRRHGHVAETLEITAVTIDISIYRLSSHAAASSPESQRSHSYTALRCLSSHGTGGSAWGLVTGLRRTMVTTMVNIGGR